MRQRVAASVVSSQRKRGDGAYRPLDSRELDEFQL